MRGSGGVVSTKHINTQIKAAEPDAPEGTFTGYASVFGNVDSYGEVVKAGAFAESLKAQSDYPVYWSHQMSDPMMNIGKTLEIREDDHGLFVKAQLDLDTPMGAQVHRLIKDGRVGQMSFAFDVEEYAPVKSKELGDHVELQRLKLHEVSVVQVGANQATELLDVKARVAQVKADHVVTKADGDKLEQAISLIREVIDGQEPPEDDDDDEDTPPEGGTSSDDSSGTKSLNPDAALANMYLQITEGA